MRADAAASAENAMIHIVNHDVPTDPVKQRKRLVEAADAAIVAAKAKIERQKQHLAGAVKDKKEAQRAHLEGANKALAQAIAARKELD